MVSTECPTPPRVTKTSLFNKVQADGVFISEENALPILLLLPSYPANPSTPHRDAIPSQFGHPHRPQPPQTVRRAHRHELRTYFHDFLASQLESIVQAALGDDDDEGPKISFDISSSKDRTQIGEYSSSHVV
jgi:hypothetical protein